MSYTATILDKAQTALDAGDKAAARELLKPIVEAEPGNSRAWYLLADATEDEEQRFFYKARGEATRTLAMPAPVQPVAPQVFYTPPPQVIYAQAPAKKKSSLGVIVLFSLFVGACIWFTVINLDSGWTSSPSGSSARATGHKVIYRITGTAKRADLTYNNASGGTEQKTVALPWSQSYTVPAGGFLYVSAQNDGQSGSVTCEIVVNGGTVKTSTSEGAYKIATCNGRLP